MAFQMDWAAGPNGDQCCAYNVITDKKYTVRELVEEIALAKPGEWGEFRIKQGRKEMRCKYENGKIENVLSEEVLKAAAEKVSAYGGWSLMDYIIEIGEKH